MEFAQAKMDAMDNCTFDVGYEPIGLKVQPETVCGNCKIIMKITKGKASCAKCGQTSNIEEG